MGRLIIPPPSAAHVTKAKGFTPSAFYSSTQLDNFSQLCGFGANETTIAQSTANPNLVVAGANTYYDDSGNCLDSHAGVYYSSDGGQHWLFEVMPGLVFPASGDPAVTFDPVRQVFLFAFVEFTRGDGTQGRIGVEASSDGVSWSRNTTLDSNNANYGTDKPSITVDQNPGSPNYGRVAVSWTQFFGNNAVYQADYTDNAGSTWHTGGTSINFTSHECGNGTSSSFDANGELGVAWADCSGGVNALYEEVSTDGGANWTAPSDTQVTTTAPIAGAEDPVAADCFLNNGGSAFRCNSFPSLAGDPNASDAGGSAFVVTWAQVRSTTQSGQTASVSQLLALSTVDDGTTWDHLAFMNFDDFGDKFFPGSSFSPNGRLTVSYSSREDDASSGNPNGKSFNEHQTEASSLTNLRASSYVSYTTDGTLGDPGSLQFIGDYAGNTSLDNNFDTFPVWTDLRSGFPSARTQDLCYADCMTFLSPESPLSNFRSGGSSFSDFYSFSMDPLTGSGNNFWNLVATREGSDGTSVDDDMFLAPNRYFNSSLTSSAQSPPRNDYLMVNGNSGNAADTAYFPQVHSFSNVGGSYSIEWDAGHLTLGTSLPDSMGSSNVGRVYDSFLSTGTTYCVGLRPAVGNTSNYTLALHSASVNDFQGRSNAVADSGGIAAGVPAFVTYNTGADPSQFDGIAVVNNNGGSGAYTLYRDTVAPSGTISIDGGAAATNQRRVRLALSATNPTAGDPVVDMAFSTDGGTTWTNFKPYRTTQRLKVPAGDGTKTVMVEFRNGAGAVSAPASDSILLDTVAPTITASPAPSFAKGKTLGTTDAPIRISWNATDAGSGVKKFTLQESVDGAAFTPVTLSAPSAESALLHLDPGHSFLFRVSATDVARNTSSFTAGAAFTLSAFQENNGAISYSSGWSRVSQAGSYGGQVDEATAAGSTADFSFNGAQIAWVSTTGPSDGIARVSLDGGPVKSVDTNAATLTPAIVVFTKTLTAGPHSLHLRVLGTSGHPRVDVDAFLVIS